MSILKADHMVSYRAQLSKRFSIETIEIKDKK